jgi:ABC-type antimicrobial peptide transport system permease subunit
VCTSLGGIVMLLSLTAMYAILSFEVTRRTREIGVRIALGARNRRVLRDILSRALLWVAAGGVLGTGFGLLLLLLARATLVMRFPATGGVTFAVLVFGAAIAGMIAAWIPARRVLRVRPMDALRID